MKPNFAPSFKAKVIIPKESKELQGIAIDDTVKINDIQYEIAPESLSIKGYKEYYTIRGHALGVGVRLIHQHESTGENIYCRPYKTGSRIKGKLNDNQRFVIKSISNK